SPFRPSASHFEGAKVSKVPARRGYRSHALVMQFVTLCVTRRLCAVRWIEVRLRSPFRPSATYFDGAKVGKPPRSGFRPDFVGFLR
ncbi:hypothetical protein ALQ44_01960, partial [Pseudomonas syringae pv. pisi]